MMLPVDSTGTVEMTGALGADEAIEAQERDILKVDRKSD